MGTRVRTKITKQKTEKTKDTLDFKEVKTVFTDTECNEHILKGWKILHVGLSHVDANGFNAKNTFILGLER